MKTIKQLLEGKDFEPHMMYHPETGEEEKAEKPEDHERLKKKGYSHEKPEVKEGQFYGQDKMAARAKSMMSPKTHVRLTREKGGYERATVLKKNKEKIAQLKKDGYKIDPTFAKESMDDLHSEALNLLHEKPELDEAVKWSMGDGKPRGGSNIENVRFWDLPKASLEYIQKDSKDAMKANPSNKKNTQGKGNYADQINDAQTVLIWRKKNGIKESVELAEGKNLIPDFQKIVKTKSAGKVGGVMIDMFTASVVTQAYDKVNPAMQKKMEASDVNKLVGLVHKLLGHKAGKVEQVSEASARADAMRAMGKRGKDSADIDNDATDDDRKAASKNVLMQVRKASDLPKGGDIEFENGKKGKISQADADKMTRLFGMLKKPQDKEKFQKIISKDLKSLQGLLKRLSK